ncbi:hypothetical protein PMZ80_008051 [Knufia obscura]|uniref:F-box domain-containing protein n=1 Tax=Knufia obscura TaxID=1635080 RepID=A0ABR0RGD5_9EURO|nr:hypothetical protein PMZ80_008051 [Knufia obscura]
MTRLTDLPPEILGMIVAHLHDDLHNSNALDIFAITRVNKQFRDIAWDVHLQSSTIEDK